MDSQKQKFLLFVGAIVLVMIAIIATPLETPKLPISLISAELNSTENLFKDPTFSFQASEWNVEPMNNSFTASGTRIFQDSNIPIRISQRVKLNNGIKGLRLYFDGSNENGSPIIISFTDEKGLELHSSYTGHQGILTEDIYFNTSTENIVISILLPQNTTSMLKSIKATPLFTVK